MKKNYEGWAFLLRTISFILAVYGALLTSTIAVNLIIKQLSPKDMVLYILMFIFSALWSTSLFLITFYNSRKTYFIFNIRNNWRFFGLLMLHIVALFIWIVIVAIIVTLVGYVVT